MNDANNGIKDQFKKEIMESILCGGEYQEVLKAIENRKVIAFGASEIADSVLKHLPQKVSYYVDNDTTKWNGNLNGTPIFGPNKLLEEKEEIAIIITSVHFDAISDQIESMKLFKYKIIDGNKLLARLKAPARLEECKSKYEDYIKKMPTLEEFNILTEGKGQKYDDKPIGIVISNQVFFYTPWYDLVLAVLLKYKGHNVIMIWDDINEFSDTFLDWEGASRYQDELLRSSINLISEKFNIEIIKISEMPEKPLDERDIEEINRLSQQTITAKYHRSFMSKELLEGKKRYIHKFSQNLKKMKSILDISEFERIITDAGLLDFAGLYMWLGKKEGFDVGTKDMCFSNGGFISTNGPSNHMMDINKILKEKSLKEHIKLQLIDQGKKQFEKNITIKGERVGGVWQEISYEEDESREQYDIVIPLNIAWDGAALGKNQFFSDIGDWLVETVEYILSNTNASIAVRQHPAEKNAKPVNDFFLMYNNPEYKYESGGDIFFRLNNHFGDNERFRYIKSYEKINTYKLIEKAKLVLPHTSTIGLEAAMMRKNVVIESDVYYSGISAIENANSKEDYFNKIKKYYKEENRLSSKDIEEVQLTYALCKLNHFKMEFAPDSYNWLKNNVMELLKDEGVTNTLKAFGEGVPIVISRAENMF